MNRFPIYLDAGFIHQLDEVFHFYGGTLLAQLVLQLQHTSGTARDNHGSSAGFDVLHLSLADLFRKLIVIEAEGTPAPAASLRIPHLHQIDPWQILHNRSGLQGDILTADEMAWVVVGYFHQGLLLPLIQFNFISQKFRK